MTMYHDAKSKPAFKDAQAAAESVAKKRAKAFPTKDRATPPPRRGRPWSIPGALAELKAAPVDERRGGLEEILEEAGEDFGVAGVVPLRRAASAYLTAWEDDDEGEGS